VTCTARRSTLSAAAQYGLAELPLPRRGFWPSILAGVAAAAMLAAPAALAANNPAPPVTPAAASKRAADSNTNSFFPGGNSKEPITIDADKLVYFDKEQKAIYTGNVVAIQGDSKLNCSVLTIYIAKNEPPGGQGAEASVASPASDANGQPPSSSTSQVKHMDAMGPLTVVSKTQVATGERGVYDKGENKVWLFGNVTMSDGANVTKGDKLTYDLTTGEAVVEVNQGSQRVHGQFIPSSNDNNGSGDKSAPSPAKKKTP
jgi:lipopolysaccharide export system protein LptA